MKRISVLIAVILMLCVPVFASSALPASESVCEIPITENGLNFGIASINGNSFVLGVDNSDGSLPIGSTVKIELNDIASNTAFVERNPVVASFSGLSFKLTASKPSREEISLLPEGLRIYVQVNELWNKKMLDAYYVGLSGELPLDVTTATLNTEYGKFAFAVFECSYTGDFFLFDSSSGQSEHTASSVGLTKGEITVIIVCSSLLFICFAGSAVLIVYRRKKCKVYVLK